MIKNLSKIKKRFLDLEVLILNAKNVSNYNEYSKLIKEYNEKSKILNLYKNYKNITYEINKTKDILLTEKDTEFCEEIRKEILFLKKKKEENEIKLKNMLIENDPNDLKNIILEIRSGIGGDEAAIFAGDLFRMYKRFSEKKK